MKESAYWWLELMVYGVQLGCLIFKLIKSSCWTSFDITWYTPDLVCDDDFGIFEAESACNTLGYTNGGFIQTYNMDTRWSQTEIPFLMDDVQCESTSTSFLSCTSLSQSDEDCDHRENVLLTCFDPGKAPSGSFWVF